MRKHFCTCHPNDQIEIIEEGKLQCCPDCDEHVNSPMPAHFASQFCKKQAARRAEREQNSLQEQAKKIQFHVDNQETENVHEFKHLGCMPSDDDTDDTAALTQLKKARAQWGLLVGMLRAEGADSVTMGKFHMATAQSVSLCGSESWASDSWKT